MTGTEIEAICPVMRNVRASSSCVTYLKVLILMRSFDGKNVLRCPLLFLVRKGDGGGTSHPFCNG